MFNGCLGRGQLLPQMQQLRLKLGVVLEHNRGLVTQLTEAGGQGGGVTPGPGVHQGEVLVILQGQQQRVQLSPGLVKL